MDQSDGITNSNPPEQTYADAIRKPPVPAALSIPLRQAVVSAVYADFKEKDRRAKNVVISGLPTSSVSDKSSVEKLSYTEFGITPQVVKCHRLGQSRSGSVQPLVIVLRTVEEAEFLIKNAKLLHQSHDPSVKVLST